MNNAEKLVKSFNIAFKAHKNQKRDGGRPYIEHPVAVVKILTDEFGVTDIDTLCAAVLHDVVEDSNISYEQLLDELGLKVELMVKILTKTGLTKEVYYNNLYQASEGVRLIKLADRLHNIRGMETWDEKRKAKYIEETRRYIIPLAQKTSSVALAKIREVVG